MFYFINPPLFTHKLFPQYLWQMPKDKKAIYLTFDDGPTPQITEWVLELLDKYNAKATFFVEGQNAVLHPDILHKIVDKKHRIGNHSFSHFNGWTTKTPFFIEDVEKAHNILVESLLPHKLTQKKLFRPPYGKLRKKQTKALQSMGYTLVLGDILTGDFDPNINPKKNLKKVLRIAKSGSIVIFHDSTKAFDNLKAMLPKALEYWSKEGYEFLTL